MKMKNLVILGAIGIGFYYLLSRRIVSAGRPQPPATFTLDNLTIPIEQKALWEGGIGKEAYETMAYSNLGTQYQGWGALMPAPGFATWGGVIPKPGMDLSKLTTNVGYITQSMWEEYQNWLMFS